MFHKLIVEKRRVQLFCGQDTIVGTITKYYDLFQLIKIDNILIPVELIHHIEVLDEASADAVRNTRYENEGSRRSLL